MPVFTVHVIGALFYNLKLTSMENSWTNVFAEEIAFSTLLICIFIVISGMLRRNGKQHKIRVKKIFVSSEIKPTTESRFAYDYAILKLNRPHEKPYVKLKAAKGTVRSLSFYVFGRENKKRTSMYKFSHCQVMNRYDLNNFKIPFKDCPSSSGDSGSAVFESSGDKKAVIGLVSATAKYRSSSGGRIFTTVVLRFTDFDIARINSWIAKS